MRSRIAGSSSMTSTVAPVRASAGAGAPASAAVPSRASTTSTGSRIVKVLPRPSALDTVTSPPMSEQSRRVSDSPSPVPPKRRLVEVSAWENSWNRRPICSSVMPMPVSVTSNTSTSPPSAASRRTASDTVPRSVNLHALDRRLNSDCRTLVRSARISPTAGAHRTSMRFAFLSASGRITSAMSSTSRGTSNASR